MNIFFSFLIAVFFALLVCPDQKIQIYFENKSAGTHRSRTPHCWNTKKCNQYQISLLQLIFPHNYKVQFFHLGLQAIYSWKTLPLETHCFVPCVRITMDRLDRKVPLIKKNQDFQIFYLFSTTGLISSIKSLMESFQFVAKHSIEKLSILVLASESS